MKEVSNQDVLHTLNQRSRLFSKSLNTALKKHDIYASQWSILYCLHESGPMTQTDIWKYLNVEAPTITRTIAKMEKNGWVIRKQGTDKRERIIELTEKAKEQFPAIFQTVQHVEHDVLQSLSLDERKQLYHLLNKLN